jgi:hypothetical protein
MVTNDVFETANTFYLSGDLFRSLSVVTAG